MTSKTDVEAIPASFYDQEYFTKGTKSNYSPYGPGNWSQWLQDMLQSHLDPHPGSVLDVGCAYGYMVERIYNGMGIVAWGFDISEYAVTDRGVIKDRMWVGDAADPDAWERVPTGGHKVDLVLSLETPEHLTEPQAVAFLELAHRHAKRALLLIATEGEGGAADGDLSHITIKPMSWWEDAAKNAGWVIADASLFNEDWRSGQMGWAGRWLALSKEA